MSPKDIKIIAEVSSNHSGNIFLAKEFIHISSQVGADFVKFQTYKYEDLLDKNDPQAKWIKKTSLSEEDHFMLIEECKKNNINFLTTCFSIKRVQFLASLELEEIKVASPDLLSFSMIEKLAQHFKHLIISVGMHTLKEIKKVIEFLTRNKIKATLLHTTSLYPSSLDKAFMYKFLWLKDNYPRVGFSNHIPGIETIKFAMAHGAQIVEAHMKLGKLGPGRASPWDILPEEFEQIYRYREELSSMLGEKDLIKNTNFLFPEEKDARKRFIGRWGNNR